MPVAGKAKRQDIPTYTRHSGHDTGATSSRQQSTGGDDILHVHELEGRKTIDARDGVGGRGGVFFDEAWVVSGVHRDLGEFMICSELLDYGSREVKRDASVMKQGRTAQEEQRLLHRE